MMQLAASTMDSITMMISSVGFPIVCTFALFKMYNSEVKELKQAVENNTRVVERLLDRLDAGILKEDKE